MQHGFLKSPSSIASEQTFATCGTFLRTARKATAEGADIAVLGVPFDLATSNRPGARFGPAAVRTASANLAELKAYPGGFDPLEFVKCVDLGDINIDPGNPHKIVDAITRSALEVIETGAFLLALGGDHFISYPLLQAHARRHGPLALVHFDAHSDTWSSPNALNEPVELNHGTMFSRAILEGLIEPLHSVQIGIRTWVDDTMGMTIIDSEGADARTPAEIAGVVARVTAGKPVYLTVDIDCLDPAFAPGTGTPVTGGLNPIKLMQTLRALRPLNIVGSDVVEVAPPYDTDNITALNAATVAYEQICRLALRNGASERRYADPMN